MNLSLNFDDYLKWIHELIDKKPNKIKILSYGIYGGITYTGDDTKEWGQYYHLHIRDILDRLVVVPNVEMIIGIAPYKSCKGKQQCVDCEKQYCKNLLRIISHAEYFDKLVWKLSSDLHMRANLFEYDNQSVCVVSGRNFTDSPWEDFSIKLIDGDCDEIKRYIDKLSSAAMTINEDILPTILEEQQISEQGFKSVIEAL